VLGYLSSLPPSHLAHRALLVSQALADRGKPSWIGDLATVLQRLGVKFDRGELSNFGPDTLISMSKRVYAAACREVDAGILANKHLYLMHNRLEPSEDGARRKAAMTLRHYLTRISSTFHRRSLTWLLCGITPFATARLRGSNPPVPYANRTCRFCRCHVESPEHVLIQCGSDGRVSSLRDQLFATTSYRIKSHGPFSDVDALAILRDFERFSWGLE
jgi:hypothetical protein